MAMPSFCCGSHTFMR
uniref:Uncharacterized protein n=1 Tax=Anguilla anguilla TaxID=7936 RepID=A0A0E9VAM0_ANGAN